MLNTLEARLGAPETAYAALVFYQLRRLWQAGRELLTQFVADLARQQDERERRVHLAQHNRRAVRARARAAQTQLAGRAGAAARRARRWSRRSQSERARLDALLALLQAPRARAAHPRRARAAARGAGRARPGAGRARGPRARGAAGVSRPVARRRAAPSTWRRSPTRRCCACGVATLKTPLVALAREATGAARGGATIYGTPKECVLLMGQISARADA